MDEEHPFTSEAAVQDSDVSEVGGSPPLRTRQRKTVRLTGPTAWHHVSIWALAALFAPLLPFAFRLMHSLDGGRSANPAEILGTGDLLLIAVVFIIAGLAEILLVVNKLRQTQVAPFAFISIGGLLLVLGDATWYADLASAMLDGHARALSSTAIAVQLALFISSAFVSCAWVKMAAGVR